MSFLELFKLEKDKRGIVSSSSKSKKGEKRGRRGVLHRKLVYHFLRESVFLLSSFLNDPTIGSLRDKKKNCSTWKGLRVGTKFEEF